MIQRRAKKGPKLQFVYFYLFNDVVSSSVYKFKTLLSQLLVNKEGDKWTRLRHCILEIFKY
jgi:hypothetical protein